MADAAAARREARRRRILDNSESRLQKITGSTSPIINSNEEIKTGLSEPILPKSLNGLNVNENSSSDTLWAPTPDIEHQEFERKFQQLQSQLCGENNLYDLSARLRQLTADAGHQNNLSDLSTRLRQLNANSDSDDQVSNLIDRINEAGLLLSENKKNSTKTTTDNSKLSVFLKFISGIWIYVVLAAIVNIMMIFKMENIFGTSIFVPFIIVFTIRIWLFIKAEPTQMDNMMMAALVIFRIRPKLMTSIKTFIKLSTVIFKELFFYIFSFVFIYTFISHYWLNIVDLNEPKIIDNSKEL
ncbi:hypothetical protein HCN44_008653 [Aphidius gifuensis]|uniref:Uncharacterized protein n=1 Tax=Aphidius gifuensis TaxID=684658 RepID=A0A834XRK2_APHGI|nr:uncharacterized protein LOC122858400 [Aphidius gifuensis]KAF7989979.1 hypothetical protein HCN44_008653 [Aphidius gifuensis]